MQSNLNKIKSKVQNNDEKVTFADEQFLLAKELGCLGDIIGREYELIWIDGRVVGFRQKPIDIPTYINIIKALEKYKKMEKKQMKRKGRR